MRAYFYHPRVTVRFIWYIFLSNVLPSNKGDMFTPSICHHCLLGVSLNIEGLGEKMGRTGDSKPTFLCPRPERSAGASSNWIVRLFVRLSVCPFVCLSVIPSRLQSAIIKVWLMIK